MNRHFSPTITSLLTPIMIMRVWLKQKTQSMIRFIDFCGRRTVPL